MTLVETITKERLKAKAPGTIEFTDSGKKAYFYLNGELICVEGENLTTISSKKLADIVTEKIRSHLQ